MTINKRVQTYNQHVNAMMIPPEDENKKMSVPACEYQSYVKLWRANNLCSIYLHNDYALDNRQ